MIKKTRRARRTTSGIGARAKMLRMSVAMDGSTGPSTARISEVFADAVEGDDGPAENYWWRMEGFKASAFDLLHGRSRGPFERAIDAVLDGADAPDETVAAARLHVMTGVGTLPWSPSSPVRYSPAKAEERREARRARVTPEPRPSGGGGGAKILRFPQSTARALDVLLESVRERRLDVADARESILTLVSAGSSYSQKNAA